MSGFNLNINNITDDIIKFEKDLIEIMDNVRKNTQDRATRSKARQLV